MTTNGQKATQSEFPSTSKLTPIHELQSDSSESVKKAKSAPIPQTKAMAATSSKQRAEKIQTKKKSPALAVLERKTQTRQLKITKNAEAARTINRKRRSNRNGRHGQKRIRGNPKQQIKEVELQLIQEETRRERLKSALYPRLKKRKKFLKKN